MDAYIVAGFRTAVAKAPRGNFRFTRPDDLAAEVIKHLLTSVPSLDPARVDDLIVGCAVPEAEQGMQVGRMIALMALPLNVPGMVVNRYCGSGMETIALASFKIHAGMADCIVAGGVESMSMVPVAGWKTALNYEISKNHPDWYSSMGATAEAVAKDYGISREDQDKFALRSHTQAINAIKTGLFAPEIVPIKVTETYVDASGKRKTKEYVVDTDEGPRADTNLDALAKLKPVFAANGTVTAGNSSQTSDGAAFVVIMSEKMVKELNIKPIARMMSHAAAGVDPRIMGIGPVEAIPLALKKAGLKQNEVQLIELNEAFASQALAVCRKLDLNQDIVNVNGGAIALGHPLGCTGTKLSVQLFNEMHRRKLKYGMVSACVGGGQGVAGVYELIN
ncbi:MAG: acetyl-CoA C-acyltransferase [Cytophagales bacterium]|nr:acetyl-CoA C-acyltransferase [Cytophagales bacterium]